MVGDLHSDGEIQIDGGIEGDIRCMTLLIGETADIRGEIVADAVIVHGRLTGQIKAKSVNLAATAHVIGDILHEDLSIETGAFLEGHCKRIIEKPKLEAPAKLSKPETAAVTVGSNKASGSNDKGKSGTQNVAKAS